MQRDFKLIHYLLNKKVVDLTTGCWFIEGETKKNNYRKGNYNGESYKLATLSAIAFLKFDPSNNELKLEICHKCDIKACFNPDHLYIGTHGSNKRDWFEREARISENHCIHGHEYTLNDQGIKICKQCQRINTYNSLKRRWPDKAIIYAKKYKIELVN